MSHRTALALSVAVTLILAVGILAGRDRLFEAGATAGTTAITSAPATSGAGVSSTSDENTTGAAPRVIEIPFPAADQAENLRQTGDEERRARERDSDDEHERVRHGDDDDREEEDDD